MTHLYISNADGQQNLDLWFNRGFGSFKPTFVTIPIGSVVHVGDLDDVTYANVQAQLMQLAIPAHANKTKPGPSWGTTMFPVLVYGMAAYDFSDPNQSGFLFFVKAG